MNQVDSHYQLPRGLPVPEDDGACAHLTGMAVPAIALPSTAGGTIDLSTLKGRSVVYCYPRTTGADRPSPPGWDDIPGARGCTLQACSFRDHYQDMRALGVREVFGLSTQDTEYQREVVERLRLPFALLSDESLAFVRALKLPTFESEGATLVKRVTLMLHDGAVEHVFYPVFPPDTNAQAVVMWLVERTGL